jgi:hypothetical protein
VYIKNTNNGASQMITKSKCQNEYSGQVKAYTVFDGGRMIGDLFCTEEHGRGWHVVLCGRLGFSNAQFATEEGATKYMKLCSYAEANELNI